MPGVVVVVVVEVVEVVVVDVVVIPIGGPRPPRSPHKVVEHCTQPSSHLQPLKQYVH